MGQTYGPFCLIYIFREVCVVQLKMGGAFMNSIEYQDRINEHLTKLEKDMPEADRLMILDEIRELLSAFFVD